jgi:uncharacterized protein YjbI with pentapeptide repeats
MSSKWHDWTGRIRRSFRRAPRPKIYLNNELIGSRPRHDWVQLTVTALPGLAAVAALIFTALSVRASSLQLQIAEQGQITDRYNAAVTNLGSSTVDVRLGGVYALQRIMQDSPRDQPTVIAVLCAFARDQAAKINTKLAPSSPVPSSALDRLPTDIQAALTVVGTRDVTYDGATVVDISDAKLPHAVLAGANLSSALLMGADLSGSDLTNAKVEGTDLANANLTNTVLFGADLKFTVLAHANLSGAAFAPNTNLANAELIGADISHTELDHVNFSKVDFSGANLSGANLSGADLSDANLSGADLSDADLSGANFSGAHLSGVNLSGANVTDVKGLRINGR